jgi:hypothetical protein
VKSITVMVLALAGCGGAPFSTLERGVGPEDSGVVEASPQVDASSEIGEASPTPEASSPEASPEAASPEDASPEAGTPEAGTLPEAGPTCCTVTDQTNVECAGVLGQTFTCNGDTVKCYSAGNCWATSPGTGTCDGVAAACQ